MNILLTGGTGYIGSHTAVVLAKAGHHVVLLDNLCNSQPEVADRMAEIVGQSLTLEVADVRDTLNTQQLLRAHNIQAVVHLAGLKAVGESVQQPLDYFDVNVGGAISLLKAMKAEGVRQLVFSSSATVYGQPKYLPLDEGHPTRVTNTYGRTKLQIEQMLSDLADSDPTWRIVILRYFNPVGAHASGLIGEDPSGTPNNLMPYMARVATGQMSHLNVWGSDYSTADGTGVRDYLHVMDLAEGHLAALLYLADHNAVACDVFNLGTGRGISVLQMIQAFEEACGSSVPYQIAPRRPGDVAECWANPAKAQEKLQWRASRGLDEMCASALKFCTTSRSSA
jgi:UDP-glucose 4-epimerase